jgi:nucleoside-diphosphate kinase
LKEYKKYDEKLKEYLERCLVILKPDALERGLVLDIVNAFGGYDFIAKKWDKATLNQRFLEEFYPHLVNRKFFLTEFVPYMTRGNIVYGIFYGDDIVQKIRDVVGRYTDPSHCLKTTLRRRFGRSLQENTIHRSGSLKEAEKEIRILSEYLGITL